MYTMGQDFFDMQYVLNDDRFYVGGGVPRIGRYITYNLQENLRGGVESTQPWSLWYRKKRGPERV